MKALETKRLALVPPTLDYAPDVLSYASDPEFCRYIDSAPARSVDDARAYLEMLITDNADGKRLYWLIVWEDKCIGSLGFNFLFNPRHRTQDFGYGIAPRAWGKGLFNEAAMAVLEYGFGSLGLDRIQAGTRHDNRRSIAALQRLGFEHEATLKRFYQSGEGRADCVVMARFAS